MGLLIAKAIGLLVAAILVAIAARRLHLPYTIGLVVAGMTLALSRVNLGIALTHDIVFDILLPPLLFEAALNLHWTELRRDALPILLLSVFGVIISAAIIFLGMRELLGWPAMAALMFGILIAATDPVAVISLFKNLRINGRIRLLVESESLFNDGVAAVLFALALKWPHDMPLSASSAWPLLLSISIGGILIGCAVGIGALLLAGRTGDHLVETAVTVAASYGAFLIAENLKFSGVLASVCAGLIIGSLGIHAGGQRFGLSRQGRTFVLEFWEFMAFIANSVVFLLIGVSASHVDFAELGFLPLAAAIVLVLLSRAATVYPISALLHFSRWSIPGREQHVIWWAGLRGALALALALALPLQFPDRGMIVIATFGVVTFSLAIQGLTMPVLLRWLKFSPPKPVSKG